MEAHDAGIALSVLWLSSGLAALALIPRNVSARALCATAMFASVEALLEPIAEQHRSGAAGALLPVAVSVFFLLAVTAGATILMTYPLGAVERRWHSRVLATFAVLSVLAPLALLVSAPRYTVLGEPHTERSNVVALPTLHWLGAVARVIVYDTDPVWLLLAVAVLGFRWWHADPQKRLELRPLVLGIALMAAMLAVVLLTEVVGLSVPEPGFRVAFHIALGLLPVMLLAGLSRRTRSMDAALSASRTRLITAEDAVRRSIERDLHDGVQQQLVAILSLTQLAARQTRSRPDQAERTITDMAAQVTDAITDLRELVYGIRPPVLQDHGLAAALESRLERLRDDVRLDTEPVKGRRWAPEIEAAAYFVACEGVTNAIKHAPGAAITVRVRNEHDGLVVDVADTGPGIHGSWHRGRGLSGLHDRVDSLGGTFEVEPAAPSGTRVLAHFPVGTSG